MKHASHTTQRLRSAGLAALATSTLILSACGAADVEASDTSHTSESMTQETSGVVEHETASTTATATPVLENPNDDHSTQTSVAGENSVPAAPAPEASAPEPAVPDASAPSIGPGDGRDEPPAPENPGSETDGPGTDAPEDGGADESGGVFDVAPGNLCDQEQIGQTATTADGQTVKCVDESVKPYTGVWKLV